MKYLASLVIGALLISLFASCSKRPAPTTWASSDSFVIEPGVSVGPVHSGMTMEQVVAVLGEPDKDRFGNLDYLKLGITVIVSDDRKGGIVFSVVCFPAGDSGMERAFTGHTKDGIGLGASRAAIVSAYGNPPATNSVLELESMKYHSLGIDFGLKDGKLLMITVVFKP